MTQIKPPPENPGRFRNPNQQGSMGGKFVRTIGIVRAAVKIGMQNLADNMHRLVVLERIAVAAG